MPIPESFRRAREAHNATVDPVAAAMRTAAEILPAGYALGTFLSKQTGERMVSVNAPDGSRVDIAAPGNDPAFARYATPRSIVDAATCAVEHNRRAARDRFRAAIVPAMRAAEDAWLAVTPLQAESPEADALHAWQVCDAYASTSGPGVAVAEIRRRTGRPAYAAVYATLRALGLAPRDA